VSNDIEMEDGWEDQLTPLINTVVMRATTAVCKDAKAICPVDTGALKESLTPINAALMVGRVISDREYAAAVELGFHGEVTVRAHTNRDFMGTGRTVEIREHTARQSTPAQPYFRPALYRSNRDLSGGA